MLVPVLGSEWGVVSDTDLLLLLLSLGGVWGLGADALLWDFMLGSLGGV